MIALAAAPKPNLNFENKLDQLRIGDVEELDKGKLYRK